MKLFVLSHLRVEMKKLQLVVLFHGFYFEVQIFIMSLRKFESSFDGFYLMIESVDIGELW